MTQGFTGTIPNAVTSVTGTSNRIIVTGTKNAVVDIDTNYVGQSSITTLGTIGTGTWQGTAIDETAGGTGQTSYTTGDILYASASNTLTKLAAGTTGQVLKQGATVPEWGSSSGVGSWQYISSVTASSSSTLDFTSGIDSSYINYMFYIDNIMLSTSSNFYIRISADGGSTFKTTGYGWGDINAGSSYAGTEILISGLNLSTTIPICGNIMCYNPSGTTQEKSMIIYYTSGTVNGVFASLRFGGHQDAAAYNAIRFYPSTGNFVSGTIRMYGLLPS